VLWCAKGTSKREEEAAEQQEAEVEEKRKQQEEEEQKRRRQIHPPARPQGVATHARTGIEQAAAPEVLAGLPVPPALEGRPGRFDMNNLPKDACGKRIISF